jgi:hypothetical protein
MDAFAVISQFSRMLTNLDAWLAAGVEFAKKKEFEPDVLAQSRLAPDQFELVRQVQSACDAAKFAAAYLSGQKAPSHPDVEKTVAELRARIKTCTDYLATFKAADFGGAYERRVGPPWMGGATVRGDHYVMRLSIPNFYFHVTTAYAILRHNGVGLGKSDFIGVKDFSEAASWS